MDRLDFTEITDVGADYSERYPNGLDLRPGAPDHQRLLSELNELGRRSSAAVSQRFPYWKKIDHTLTSYIDLEARDTEHLEMEGNANAPVPVVYPMTTGILEGLLAYFVGVFFSDNLIKYRPRASNDVVKARLIQQLIHDQLVRTKSLLDIFIMWRSAFAYGYSYAVCDWKEIFAWKRQRQPIQEFSSLMQGYETSGYQETRSRVLRFEGNDLMAVDPYHALPDPDVPVHAPQEMRSFGWLEPTTLYEMLSRERDDENIFNVQYLRRTKARRTTIINPENGRMDRTEESRNTEGLDNINYLYQIIPAEVGLGDGEYPETWLFTVSADQVITQARPVDLDHDMLPVVAYAPEFDGFSTTPVSRLEKVVGMQTILDSYLNNHMVNVRKGVNNLWLVDPLLINVPDLQDPRPGKLIRMNKNAWGRGVKDAIMPLPVNDVTRQHVADAQVIISLMQSFAGLDAASTVRRRTSERVSATEAQNDISNVASKVSTLAWIFDQQVLQDLGYMLASHNRQYMSQETWVQVMGGEDQQLAELYGQLTRISPEEIDEELDVIPHQGIQNVENPTAMATAFQAMVAVPEIAQQFDIVRVFTAIAKASGFKTVGQFARQQGIQPRVAGTEEVEQGRQKGNLVTAEEFLSAQAPTEF